MVDLDAIEAMGVCPVLGDYLSEDNVARHATDRVADRPAGAGKAGAEEKTSVALPV